MVGGSGVGDRSHL